MKRNYSYGQHYLSMKNKKQKQFCTLCTCSLSFLYISLPLSSFWQCEMTCLPLLKNSQWKMIFYWIYFSLWLDGVFPLVMDRETTAQEKCFQILDEVLLSNIASKSKLVKRETVEFSQKGSVAIDSLVFIDYKLHIRIFCIQNFC